MYYTGQGTAEATLREHIANLDRHADAIGNALFQVIELFDREGLWVSTTRENHVPNILRSLLILYMLKDKNQARYRAKIHQIPRAHPEFTPGVMREITTHLTKARCLHNVLEAPGKETQGCPGCSHRHLQDLYNDLILGDEDDDTAPEAAAAADDGE